LYTPLPGDRRAGRRTPLEIDVVLTRLTRGANHTSGVSVDIADGGVFVCVRHEGGQRLDVGHAVELALSIPGGGKVVAIGEVRWVRAAGQGVIPGVGIAFSKMSPIDRAMMERFLSS
jgi:hypothetical protein